MAGQDVFLLTGGAQQLVNAFEARHAFGAARPVLVCTPGVIAFGALEYDPWDRVDVLQLRRPSHPLAIRHAVWSFKRRLRRALAGIRVGRLFIGHYGEAFRAIAEETAPGEVVLLDDGTAVIKAARDRRLELTGQSPHRGFRRSLRRHFMPPEVERLTYFSALSPELGPNDRLVFNTYSWVRAAAASRPVRATVDFLGQPLWRNGDLNAEVYWRAVSRIVTDETAGCRYLCHASEPIEEVRRRLAGLSVAVERPMRPYELQLASQGPPMRVVGFASSALVTAASIVGAGRVVAYRIPENRFESGTRRRTIFHGIYEAFGKNAAIDVRHLSTLWEDDA